MRLCLNMLIFTHNLGNWLIFISYNVTRFSHYKNHSLVIYHVCSSVGISTLELWRHVGVL